MIAEIILNDLNGSSVVNPSKPTSLDALAAPYTSLITSEHNQLPKFMSMMTAVCGSIAEITAGIRSITPAFDLDKAVGAQLDIVGLWVGQSRVIDNVLLQGFFGFSDDPEALTFGEINNPAIGGIFAEYGQSVTTTTVLEDNDYRTVLRARIVRNQSSGTLADIERALNFVFGAQCRIVDPGNFNLTIFVSTPITPTQQTLLRQLDILPRPAAISINNILFSGTPPPPNNSAGVLKLVVEDWQESPSWRTQTRRR